MFFIVSLKVNQLFAIFLCRQNDRKVPKFSYASFL